MVSKIRKELSYHAQSYKREYGVSYSDLEDSTEFSRKQISAVLHGKSGVSIEKIEEFFLKAFNVEFELYAKINPNSFDDEF